LNWVLLRDSSHLESPRDSTRLQGQQGLMQQQAARMTRANYKPTKCCVVIELVAVQGFFEVENSLIPERSGAGRLTIPIVTKIQGLQKRVSFFLKAKLTPAMCAQLSAAGFLLASKLLGVESRKLVGSFLVFPSGNGSLAHHVPGRRHLR
jgi:hypothetical protein